SYCGFFFSSRRRHTRFSRDWSSDVCSSDLGSILDQDWVVAQGGWDGSCETWQNYYAMTSEEDPLSLVTNGTGPFSLASWEPDVEIGRASCRERVSRSKISGRLNKERRQRRR